MRADYQSMPPGHVLIAAARQSAALLSIHWPTPPRPHAHAWLGIERNSTTHGEKWISAIGALLGIMLVVWVTHALFPQGFDGHQPGAALLLASMGASALLLFAVPHRALSQP